MKQYFFCPICKAKITRSAEHFPFCKEQCKIIDLGNWADGSYAIPAEKASLDHEESEDLLH